MGRLPGGRAFREIWSGGIGRCLETAHLVCGLEYRRFRKSVEAMLSCLGDACIRPGAGRGCKPFRLHRPAEGKNSVVSARSPTYDKRHLKMVSLNRQAVGP